jgi:hypothetical protein
VCHVLIVSQPQVLVATTVVMDTSCIFESIVAYHACCHSHVCLTVLCTVPVSLQYHDLTARASPIKALVSSSSGTKAKQNQHYNYSTNGMTSPSATGARMWGVDTSLSRKGSLSFADSMR